MSRPPAGVRSSFSLFYFYLFPGFSSHPLVEDRTSRNFLSDKLQYLFLLLSCTGCRRPSLSYLKVSRQFLSSFALPQAKILTRARLLSPAPRLPPFSFPRSVRISVPFRAVLFCIAVTFKRTPLITSTLFFLLA